MNYLIVILLDFGSILSDFGIITDRIPFLNDADMFLSLIKSGNLNVLSKLSFMRSL